MGKRDLRLQTSLTSILVLSGLVIVSTIIIFYVQKYLPSEAVGSTTNESIERLGLSRVLVNGSYRFRVTSGIDEEVDLYGFRVVLVKLESFFGGTSADFTVSYLATLESHNVSLLAGTQSRIDFDSGREWVDLFYVSAGSGNATYEFDSSTMG